MAAQAKETTMSRVALLGREDQVRAQLRAALLDAGAEVALERDLAGVKLDELRACEAVTVIVNLDPGSEDVLDQLDDLIADPDVKVVFNESETTGQLAGWDLARWARHLVAKVVGHGDSTPPPPPGAELLPSRDLSIEPGAPLSAQREAGESDLSRAHEEAAASSGAVPSSPRIVDSKPRSAEPDIVPIEIEREPVEPSQEDLAIGSIEREPMHDEPAVDDATVEVSVMRPADDQNLDKFSLDVGEIEGALAGIEAGSRPGLAPGAGAEAAMPRRLGPDEPTVIISRDDLEQALDAAAASALEQLPAEHAVAAAETERSAAAGEGEEALSIDFDDTPEDLSSAANDTGLPRRLGPDEPTTVLELGDLEAELHGLADTIDDSDLTEDVADTLLDEDGGLDVSLDVTSEAGLDLDGVVDTLEQELESMEVAGSADGNQGVSIASDDFDGDLSLDDDVAALAAQFDALSAGGGNEASLVDDFSGELELEASELGADFDGDKATEGSPAGAKADRAAEPVRPAAVAAESDQVEAGGGFGELALLDLDADIAQATSSEKKATGDYDFGSLDFSLEPLDEPQEEGAETASDAAAGVAPRVKPAPGISRVVVLAASIGGPDAVRTFLSGIPKDFPALFLLSQHLESGFFGRLAQQLQKVTPLTVRVAERGADPVCNGEVVVVPSGAVYNFATDGRIESFEYSEAPRYKPCIDDLLREVAGQFGAKVTAIVFSGMAGDGVEGAAETTRKGGEVWAQSPASCVVSSMVDGALARGVVEFVGTPRELAERMVQKYAAG